MQIEVFTQSAIKLSGDKIFYFDPFKIIKNYNDADYLFITHDHYDHYDEESIKKVINTKTLIVVPKILEDKVRKITDNILVVEPSKEYQVYNFTFQTIPAYNKSKDFHPKENGYVGYLLNIDKQRYYIMGDTDVVEEAKKVKTDICFIPIGGYYTMDVYEAANYINSIKPQKVIPIHYGSIIGDINLQEEFKKLINNDITVDIYIREEK